MVSCLLIDDFFRLEKTLDTGLPLPLKVLLTEIDGGIYFMDKPQLSCRALAELVAQLDDSRSKLWKSGRLLPFCGAEDSLLAIDLKTGEVVEWDSDDGITYPI